MLSVIIPVIDAATTITDTTHFWLDSDVVGEIIIVDGGSADATPELAQLAGARVVTAPKGRGIQLAAGSDRASGDWLLFMHLDTRTGPGWETVTRRFISDPGNHFRAGYFSFALDDFEPAARRVEKVVAWRCSWFGLPYGDQGLLIHADFYEKLGGFPSLPLMEDVALIRKIARHRLEALPALATSSAKRYKQDGYFLRTIRNLFCLGMYFVGVPPHYLVDLYEGSFYDSSSTHNCC